MSSSDDELFRNELRALLESEAFLRAPALGRLLSFLSEQTLAGEGAVLKEVVVGHALYAKPASYDPQLDSTVRVNANRLRLRLEEHYRSRPEARARIVLPKGSYVPVLQRQEFAVALPLLRRSTDRQPEVGASAASRDLSESTGQEAGSRQEDIAKSPLWVLAGAGHRRHQVAFVSVAVLAAVLCGIFWMAARRPATAAAETSWSVRPFARLGGSQQFGDFSPDGRSLVFTSTSTGDLKKAIYIQSIASDEAQRLTAGTRPAWSPDGKQVAFLRLGDAGRKQVVLYTLATGAESKIAEVEGRWPWLCEVPHLSWSPDGSTLYTSASVGGDGACGVVAIDVASHAIRSLTKPDGSIGDLEAAVSPDGRSIAFLRSWGFANSDIYVVGAGGGSARRVTHDNADIIGFAWKSDGTGFVAASNRDGGVRRLWQIAVHGGEPQALTDGASAPTFPAVGPQGRQINFTQFHVTAPIWREDGRAAAEVLDNQSLNSAPAISPDGNWMLYTSNRSGKGELWRSRADGSESRLLLRGGAYETGTGRWSPDGRRIVFECRQAGPTHICLTDSDGNVLRQLTSGAANDIVPSWSRDGKSVYYTSNASGSQQIYRMDMASGEVVQVTRRGGYRALESWDGQWLYVARGQPLGGMVALPVRGSERDWLAAERAPFLTEFGADTSTDWDASKDGLVYRVFLHANSAPALDVYDMRTRTSRPLVVLKDLPQGTELTLSVMPDGRGVVYTAESTHSELNVMVANRTMPVRGAELRQEVSLRKMDMLQ